MFGVTTVQHQYTVLLFWTTPVSTKIHKISQLETFMKELKKSKKTKSCIEYILKHFTFLNVYKTAKRFTNYYKFSIKIFVMH